MAKCHYFVVASHERRTPTAMSAKKPATRVNAIWGPGDFAMLVAVVGDEDVGHDSSLPFDHDMPPVFHVAPVQVASAKLLQAQASEFVGNPLARLKLLMVGTDGEKPET